MSLNSKVILSFFAAAFAALLAWIIIDFNGFYRIQPQGMATSYIDLVKAQSFVGAVFGILLGAAIGFVNGIDSGSSAKLKRDVLWGAFAGLCGGLLGLMIGQWFFGSLYHNLKDFSEMKIIAPIAFVFMILVRGIGWGLIGLFLGLSQGIPSKSNKASRHGAIGGLIGGLLGGMLFEIIPYIIPFSFNDPGVISRGISMTITGAFIGLFIGLVQNIFKQAWIRVVKGKNEGKEYIISKPKTTIGRDELADIPLFGDINIAKLHAIINMNQYGRYIIQDSGSVTGITINNQKVIEQELKDGDIISAASINLEFHQKAGKKIIPQRDIVKKSGLPNQSNSLVCQFCGKTKDPVTGDCECSIKMSDKSSINSVQDNLNNLSLNNMIHITGISSQYSGRSFNIAASGETTIGRDSSNTICLAEDNTISRFHAYIKYETDLFVLYDNGSSNGTFVNGVKINKQVINIGDKLQFGASLFILKK